MSSPGRPRRPRYPPDANQLDLFAAWPPTVAANAHGAPAPPNRPEEPTGALNVGSSVAIFQASPERLSGPTGEVLALCNKAGPRVLPTNMKEILLFLQTVRRKSRAYTEMASAVRRLAVVLELDLADIPADPAALARLLAGANPARIGIRPPRWGRIISLLRSALAEVGFDVMPGRDVQGLSPAWKALAAPLNRRMRYGLSKFFSYCSRRGISPEGVDQTIFEAFFAALTGSSLQARPLALYRNMVNIWNEAAATVPRWPAKVSVAIPDGRRAALPVEAFAASFQADVQACLADAGEPDVFAPDYRRKLRPATILARRKKIYHAARTLVASGMPISEITSLAVLVDVANAETVLRRLRDEKGQIPSLGGLAQTLCSVAAGWVKASQSDQARLKAMARNLTVKQKGMTVRNRSRLRQFELQANSDALLHLPWRVQKAIARKPQGNHQEALRMAMAVAVGVLIAAPIRLINLNGLRLDKHIRIVPHGRKAIVRISIPGEETKTGAPIELTLDEDIAKLLIVYLKTYRPRLAGGEGPFLFPGRGGARRAESTFSAAISKFIRRETGLVVHTHLFRHLSVLFHLEDHPGDTETLRALLGHTNDRLVRTTYGSPRTDAAFEKWGRTVADRRARAIKRKPSRKPKGD